MTIHLGNALGRWTTLCGLVLTGLWLGGCHTPPPRFSDIPGQPAPAPPTAPAAAATALAAPAGESRSAVPAAPSRPGTDVLQVGDPLTAVFSDTPTPLAPLDVTIREDGTITLLFNKQFHAAGKTRGELEKEVHDAYVPSYYQNLTVTLKTQTQFYHVGGEVKVPNRYPYINATTVLKAVQSAGDFTDFARKTKVKLIRTDGHLLVLDCRKAKLNPSLDLPVFPGDRIDVPRRTWPWQK